MKQKLKYTEYIAISSMLFGLFFGAGNLIFPAQMGQLAGANMWSAAAGFIVTGVGLPLLAIIGMGMSRSNGLLEMGNRVSKGYSLLFTICLYLTIGPFFAIPRTATVSFSVGLEPLLGEGGTAIWLAVFSVCFFAIVLFFSLNPTGILTWVGKILNPMFLAVLAILIITALTHPLGSVTTVVPESAYHTGSFFTGLMEGYNTMDVLAALAFGIVVINVLRRKGIEEPGQVAADMVKSGFFSMLLMAVIYISIIVVGAQSRGVLPVCNNGGEVLALVAREYFGPVGQILLAIMITLACLKTAIGLVTSISETFVSLTSGKIIYSWWAIGFSLVSFLIANLGLNKIVAYSIPVLMLLYPLAITLILLSIFGKCFGYSREVFQSVTILTFMAAVFDFMKALPEGARNILHVNGLVDFAVDRLPLFNIGLGWIVPAVIGAVIGLLWRKMVSST
ncbi:MAG: branched-chain amino acid transport system II carrier protein [Lachnospiraceae bacterium]|nr:branched-chain amino acid transport system II carrier protein [Lachnospiraceae bacterium]